MSTRARFVSVLSLAAAVLAAGCVLEPTDGVGEARAAIDDDPGNPDPTDPGATTVTNVTISGREMFDDWRDYGRFALRKNAAGATGKHHDMSAATATHNYLGLRDATVSIYEVDASYSTIEGDCQATALVGTAVVGMDGAWSWTGSFTDGCHSDDDPAGKVKLAAKVKLTYCDDVRCFSVVDPDTGSTNETMTIWNKWIPGATSSAPRTLGSGGTAALATDYFDDSSTLHDDEREVAAQVFAGIVDITRKFHVQASWPFFLDEDGPVWIQYPSSTDTSNTHDPTIEIKDGQLREGWVPIHEYGHILHSRANRTGGTVWGPDSLVPCGNDFDKATTDPGYVLDTASECESWSRSGESEYKSKAWKEGFADFAAHVALDGVDSTEAPPEFTVGCSSPAFDPNLSASSSLPSGHDFGVQRIFGCDTAGNCTDAAAYPTNVARAMCDWFDGTNDDDPQRGGPGDAFAHSLESIFATVTGAYSEVGAAQLASDGLTFCDLYHFHINVQGAEVSPHYDLIRNDGIYCN